MLNLCRSVAVAAAMLALAGAANQAAAQLVTNGGFESYTTGSGGDRGIASGYGTLTGWSLGFTSGTNYGYPGIITTTQANAQYGYTANGTGIALANPNNGGATTITASSNAGNFLAWENPSNGCNCYLYQSITGLVAGTSYTLTFYEAGAVWSGSTLATADQWKVGWGTSASNSAANQTLSTAVNTPVKGFSGWVQQQMTLVASASTMVLSFMAYHGTNASQPPFALLDGVALTPAASVPEPASALLVISAIGGMIGLRRATRRRG